jgi:hypothetical protein
MVFPEGSNFSTGSFHSCAERALALRGMPERRVERRKGEIKGIPEKGEVEEGLPFMSAGNLFVKFMSQELCTYPTILY